MIPDPLRAAIESAIGTSYGAAFRIRAVTPAAGGCIHDSFCIDGDRRRCFVKINAAAFADAFAAEADGLEALIGAGVRVPRPLGQGIAAGRAFLALERLDFGGRADWANLARSLAILHRTTGPAYGWRRDNYIGATPQWNPVRSDWAGFWCDARLAPQIALARKNGLRARIIDAGERLAEYLPALLAGRVPAPSLLHGDLWNGNAAFSADGAPVLYDPAVYWGDREADLAMTELFGGFPRGFYAAYDDSWPLDAGYALRRDLYNLYHVLNHANLFGGGYPAQAETMIRRLLAEAR